MVVVNPFEEAAASVRLDGDTVDVGPVTVGGPTHRPDPRRPGSWCREGVAHDHGACGNKWNNHDPRDIEEAARHADALGEQKRATRTRTVIETPDTAALHALLREAEQRMVAEVGISAEDAALTVGALGNLVIRWLAEHLGDELAAYGRGWQAAATEIAEELQRRIPGPYPPEAGATEHMELQLAKVQGAWRDAAAVALDRLGRPGAVPQ